MELKGELSKKPRHLIQVVGRRTGISSDVIRAWERRYNAVVSERTETNRRLYTDDDIEFLLRVTLDRLVFQTSGFYLIIILLTFRKLFQTFNNRFI